MACQREAGPGLIPGDRSATSMAGSAPVARRPGTKEKQVSVEIRPYAPEHEADILALSLRAWAPVFEKMEPEVPDYVFHSFYPDGWRARQTADIQAILREGGDKVWVAIEADQVVGWVGIRLHPQDRMGELHILAVDPDHQRAGVGSALIAHARAVIRSAGMDMIMVETGGDSGHAPSRAAYEHAGFQRWPVARYFGKLA